MFIAWLNLDCGFEVCYFHGMDAYTKSWLEFAFPSYVIFLVIVVILICRYSSKFSQLVGTRNPVATLATLILLSYAKLLQNVIMVGSFAVLQYPNDTYKIVWRPDASVQYLRGKHIPLFLAALTILTVGIMYTFLLFSYQWITQLPDKKVFKWIWDTKLTSFMDAYHAPYRPRYRFWAGLLLLSRAILYITSSANVSSDPRLNLLATTVVLASLLFLKGNSTYKKWPIDMFESGLYLNVLIYCAAKFYILENIEHHNALTNTLISISFTILICIICYHMSTELNIVPLSVKNRLIRYLNLTDTDTEHTHLLVNDIIHSADESSQVMIHCQND